MLRRFEQIMTDEFEPSLTSIFLHAARDMAVELSAVFNTRSNYVEKIAGFFQVCVTAAVSISNIDLALKRREERRAGQAIPQEP